MTQRDDEFIPKRVDIDNLPQNWPTHFIDGNFWEELGRTVATFGFLETTLAKAIFVLSAKREREEITDESYLDWIARTLKSLQEPLGYLINEYEKELQEEIELQTQISEQIDLLELKENLSKLIQKWRKVKNLRNVLCHASWSRGENKDKAKLFFMNRNGKKFEIECDIAYLKQIQNDTKEMICMCINSVTMKGLEFPGIKDSSEEWN